MEWGNGIDAILIEHSIEMEPIYVIYTFCKSHLYPCQHKVSYIAVSSVLFYDYDYIFSCSKLNNHIWPKRKIIISDCNVDKCNEHSN